ncbi:DUF3301 domain-containing protein, partial [Francisella tularensis subsp. holarctica]|nr:DUF3301 domain-containing protein [Francisella tularensis subsp. holarctica]
IISEQATNTSSCKSAHNIINFDESGKL